MGFFRKIMKRPDENKVYTDIGKVMEILDSCPGHTAVPTDGGFRIISEEKAKMHIEAIKNEKRAEVGIKTERQEFLNNVRKDVKPSNQVKNNKNYYSPLGNSYYNKNKSNGIALGDR